ncbi:hypothetical protein MMC30_006535 [Trapelia coarctata]|nr:hypothetical protein [Trapelia coarctata]
MDDATETPLNEREMTPQPLRIKRRDFSDRNSGSPSFEVMNVSATATVHHESRIPRKSSFKPDLHETYAANGNIAKEDAAVSQAESSPQITSPSLNVQKTRQRNTESSRSSVQTISTGLIKSSSSSAKCTGIQTPALDGTSTHGGINASELTSQLLSRRQESSNYGHGRGASGGVSSQIHNGLGNELPSLSSVSQEAILRQPSFRHRMLNRMASGFPMELDFAQDGRTEVKLRSATLDSLQSAQTQTSFVSDSGLESTIASSASPPKTASTTAVASPESYNQANFQATKFVKPREATILGAKLTIVSEKKSVAATGVNGIEPFWVAVQVEGIVDPSLTAKEPQNDGNFLDVMVIIDNSLYTSPVALLSSCDIAGEIASALDTNRDGFAFGTTSPLGEDTAGSGVMLMPLSKISPRKVRNLLDSIVGCAALPTKNYLAEQIEHAKQHIRLHAPHFHDMEPGFVAVGHVVVLTPNLNAIPQSAYGDKSIGLHVICPGIVPWRRMATATGDGWRIHSLFQPAEPLHPAHLMKSKDHYAKIRTFISHLRSGSSSGKLLNLDFNIKASPDCVTDGSLGVGGFLSLQPGEVRTIMVKVKMRTPRSERTFLSNFDGTMGTTLNDELIEDIKALLRPRSLPIVRAKLRYNHSKLQGGTVCEVKGTASVEVSNPQFPQAGGVLSQRNERHILPSIFHVQRCLIYHLATHAETPGQALKSLRDHFSSEHVGPVCTEYLSSVVGELKYQERIIQRLELADNGDTFKELVESGSRKNVGYKPYTWVMLPDDEFLPPYGDIRQAEPRATAVNPFSFDQAITPDTRLRHMWSNATIVNASTENELGLPFEGLPQMELKVKAGRTSSENEAGPSYRDARHGKSKASVVNTSSESEATMPDEGRRQIRPSGTMVDTSTLELPTPYRRLRYMKSKATAIDALSDDDTALLIRPLRPMASKSEFVDGTSEEGCTQPQRGLRHVRSNAMIGGDPNRSPRLQRVVRHIRSKPAVNEGLEDSKDPARQIWGGLKKDKKATTAAGLTMHGESSTMAYGSPEMFRHIQAQALRNKRSVGQDTLSSMARRGQGDENVTPWL